MANGGRKRDEGGSAGEQKGPPIGAEGPYGDIDIEPDLEELERHDGRLASGGRHDVDDPGERRAEKRPDELGPDTPDEDESR